MNLIQKIIYAILFIALIIWVLLLTESSTKAEETPVKEVIQQQNEKEIVQYWTQWETHLYNKVEKTVDLPWFDDYQDLLASYAYNTCKVKVWNITGMYSCENLVLTWNSENWGWNKDTRSHANSNWTRDYWLCQLNSAYHSDFIKSDHFKNPLSQLDYCLNVWEDAKNKWTMPRYWYYKRNERNRGISFTGTSSLAWTVTTKTSIYVKAKQKQNEADVLWKQCKDSWECTK